MLLDRVFLNHFPFHWVKWGHVSAQADLSAWHQWIIRQLQVMVTVKMNAASWLGQGDIKVTQQGLQEEQNRLFARVSASQVENEIKRGETGLSTSPPLLLSLIAFN